MEDQLENNIPGEETIKEPNIESGEREDSQPDSPTPIIESSGSIIDSPGSIHSSPMNAGNNIYINQSIKEKYSFMDPTEKYENLSDDHKFYSYLDNEELRHYRDKLLTQKILIISSYYRFALRPGIHYLLNSPLFSSFQKRELKFVGNNSSREDIYFNNLINNYYKGQEKKLIIISTDETDQSSNFLKELKDETFETTLPGYKNDLTDKGLIIISVFSKDHIEYFKSVKKLPIWDVSYIEGFIKKEYADRDVPKIVEQTRRIINLNIWGKTEYEVYIKIAKNIPENKEKFYEEIISLNDKLNRGGKEDVLKEIAQENNPENYFKDKEPLTLYLIYLGTFFRDLSVSEFSYITDLFLNDPNKFYYSENNQTEKKSLLERWKVHPDYFLKKVRLKSYYSPDKEYEIISFEDESIREKFREYLYSNFPNFCHTQYIFLYSRGVVLDPEIPKRILNNLIRIACELAEREPERYAKRLLLDTTDNLARMVNEKEKADFEDILNSNVDFQKLVNDYGLKEIELSIIKNFAFGRVSLLIKAMLQQKKLVPVIGEYLNSLLNLGLDEPTVNLLEHITPGFSVADKCKWIRKVLDKGKKEIKNKAYRLLINTVINSATGLTENFFKNIKEWYLADVELKSHSSKYGLTFMIDYLDKCIKMLPYEDYGKWPSRLHCFTRIDNMTAFEKRMADIMQWLFPEKATHFYTKKLSVKDDETYRKIEFNQQIQLSLLEEIYFILRGHDEPNDDEITSKMRLAAQDIFWKQLFTVLPKSITNDYIRYLESAIEFHSTKYSQASSQDKNEKKFYKTKKKISTEFKSKLIVNKNKHLFI